MSKHLNSIWQNDTESFYFYPIHKFVLLQFKTQWWYVEGDKNEEADDDYVNEVCYDMYAASAKCNTNLDEDIQESLEEADSEIDNEEATCKFIKDAILGHIDENGFVYSPEQSGAATDFWNWALNANAKDPQFVTQQRQSSGSVTPAQATLLTLFVVGCVAMGTVAYLMKEQLDIKEGAEGLIANKDKQIDQIMKIFRRLCNS